MVTVLIKKGSGIDVLVSGHSGQKVEEEKSFQNRGKFDDLLKKFVYLAETFYCGPVSSIREWMKENITEVLTPTQVNQFIQSTAPLQSIRGYDPVSRQFFKKIIRDSYNFGYNDFHINLSIFESFSEIGRRLYGKNETLRMTCTVNRIGTIGHRSNNCSFEIDGGTCRSVGNESKGCHFDIHVPVYGLLGHDADGSIFNINKGLGEYIHTPYGAQKCTYRIGKKDLPKIVEIVPEHRWSYRKDGSVPSENKIILVHPDGSEEVERFYD